MPTEGLIVDPVNVEELRRALADAPDLTARYVKQELFRFARRVRKTVIRERMKGPKATGPLAKSPGEALHGGQFLRGKHIQGFTVGNELANLKAVSKISRMLRVHEEGATITPKQAGMLVLSRKTRVAGKGHIFARVTSVRIPARLRFESTWRRELPDGQRRIHAAMERAVRVAMERRMKAVSSVITRTVA